MTHPTNALLMTYPFNTLRSRHPFTSISALHTPIEGLWHSLVLARFVHHHRSLESSCTDSNKQHYRHWLTAEAKGDGGGQVR